MPTTIANWLVYAPDDIKLLRVSGNLEREAAEVAFLDDPFTPQETYQLARRQFDERQPRSVAVSAGFARVNADQMGQTFQVQRQRVRRADGTEGEYEEAASLAGWGAVNQSQTASGAGASGPPAAPSAPLLLEGRPAALEGLIQMQERGILPLKIRLPKSGTIYRFSRLMTSQEPLRLDATFVHLRLPWFPMAAFGLLLPLGGLALVRFRRA